ncbi:hypothetical protein U9M48_005656 [Paspalum notatum var. saurae]|uniref:Uncharacterized protein n=1 Tax=Paspalum notatum var. saurae TaxID=547442 RepID=A0AAQ3PQL0_PASNO
MSVTRPHSSSSQPPLLTLPPVLHPRATIHPAAGAFRRVSTSAAAIHGRRLPLLHCSVPCSPLPLRRHRPYR